MGKHNNEGFGLLGAIARRIGWVPTIALAGVVWFGLQHLPKSPHPTPVHHPQGHRGPMSDTLDSGLESLRQWAKRTFYDPALAAQQAKDRRKKGAKAYAAVSPAPVRITLGPKRILAAPGDRNVPPHPPYNGLADYKRYRVAAGEEKPSSTTVFYVMRIEPVAAKPIRAITGKLALRDAQGQALFVQDWHFPTSGSPGALPVLVSGRGAMHDLVANTRRIDGHPRFDALLATPEAEVTPEWSPYFVCYADGTMEGDAHAARGFDGEGLPVTGYANGVAWIIHQQYPDEIPNATLNTIVR